MKTIGLIGGTGWVSTEDYYRRINKYVNEKLAGLNFPEIILYSVNYGDIYACNETNDRDCVYQIMNHAAHKLVQSGADIIALCANTIHFTYDDLIKEIHLPFVHIADATGDAILKKSIKKVALLGTMETMEMDFYQNRLAKMGIETITPQKSDREYIHYAIMNELLKDQFLIETKAEFINIMKRMEINGAEGIILGCTEIPLLIKESDFQLPIFNTLEIHATAIAEFALRKT